MMKTRSSADKKNEKLPETEAFYDAFVERMLEEDYRIIDIFPERVKEDYASQFSITESYHRKKERLSKIYETYGEIILFLNCYFDLVFRFKEDAFEQLEDSEGFMKRFTKIESGKYFEALFIKESVMITLDHDDTSMTFYGRNKELEDLMEKLCQAKGAFFWKR